jgi:hypothetical protein
MEYEIGLAEAQFEFESSFEVLFIPALYSQGPHNKSTLLNKFYLLDLPFSKKI